MEWHHHHRKGDRIPVEMSIFNVFQWIDQSPLGAAIRESTWGFAVTETIHLLALAILGGVITIVNLRILGFGLHSLSKRISKDLMPLFLASLFAMIVSGVVMVAGEATKCYYHPAFRLKMILFLIALALYFVVHRSAIHLQQEQPSPVWLRAAGGLSLISWFGVGFAGRAIAFT